MNTFRWPVLLLLFLVPVQSQNKLATTLVTQTTQASKKIATPIIIDETITIVKKYHKAIILTYISTEILALVGVIGNRGETAEKFVLDAFPEIGHKIQQELDVRPGGHLRQRMEKSMMDFQALNKSRKFAIAVGAAVSMFPIMTKITYFVTIIFLPLFAIVEIMAVLGIIGGKGEGFVHLIEHETNTQFWRKQRKWIHEKREIFKETFRFDELIYNLYQSMKNDRTLWFGFVIGSLASMLLR